MNDRIKAAQDNVETYFSGGKDIPQEDEELLQTAPHALAALVDEGQLCCQCNGNGYTVGVRPVCCGKNQDGSCHGDCAIPEQYRKPCDNCFGAGMIKDITKAEQIAADFVGGGDD